MEVRNMIDEEHRNVRLPRFEWIANIWRPREHQEFVYRRELHEELAKKCGLHDAAVLQSTEDEGRLIEMAHIGIDFVLDEFARNGPDEAAFWRFSDFSEEPPTYWRHKVTREGFVGYVRGENLAPQEAETIRARFRRIGEAAFRMANTLVN
jgi:hypothetical protein